MNIQKGFVIPLIIALAVILAGGAVFYEVEHPKPSHQDQTPSLSMGAQTDGTGADGGLNIEDTIAGFLRASRAVTSDAGVNDVLDMYYTPEAAQHARSAASQIAPDPGAQSVLVQESHDMPDPSTIQYSSTHVVEGMATASYVFIERPDVTVNGRALKTDQKTYLVVSLQKIGNTWLISRLSFEVK